MKKPLILTTALLFSMMGSGMFLVANMCSAAEAAGTGPQINLESTLAENLMAFKGKSVTITLSSGQTVSGIVKDVRNGLVHLEKLAQKEFFDAVVIMDKIGTVEVRAR